jgi:hypothetical protein
LNIDGDAVGGGGVRRNPAAIERARGRLKAINFKRLLNCASSR